MRGPGQLHTAALFWVLIVSAAVTAIQSACAQDSPHAQQSIRWPRQIFVPAGEPNRWPPGDWVPLKWDDFNLLRRRLTENPPPLAFLESAIYRGRLIGDSIRSGTLEAAARLRTETPQFAELGLPTLAITDLRWRTEEATWGSTSQGHPLLLIERDAAVLNGRWSLQGRRVFSSIVFDVIVPPAAVSQLQLQLPDAKRLEVDGGLVSGIESAERPGWKVWTVDLGRRTTCRLAISNDSEPETLTEIQATQIAKYTVLPDELQLQVDISIQSVNGKPESLVFTVPANMKFFPVTLGGNVVLPSVRRRDSQTSVLDVNVRGVALQQGATVRLHGSMPLRHGHPRILPRIGLRQARWLRLRKDVSVARLLQLNDFAATGTHLLDAAVTPEAGSVLTFEDYARNSRVSVTVGAPPPDLSASVFSHVQCRRGDPQLTATVQIRAESGSTFTIDCLVPSEWEIARIESKSAVPIAQWRTDKTDSEPVTRLQVELSKALTPESPLDLIIWGRASAPFATNSADIPAVVPVVSGRRTVDVAIEGPPGVHLSPSMSTSFAVTTMDVIVDEWPGPLPESLPHDEDQLVVLRSTDPELSGQLRVNRESSNPIVSDAVDETPGEDHVRSQTEGNMFSAASDVDESTESRTARLSLRTLVAANQGRLCRNEAIFQFAPTRDTRRIHLRIPRSARLLSVGIDAKRGNVVATHPLTADVDLYAGTLPVELAVSYESSLSLGMLLGHAEVALPKWDGRISQIAWEIVLPTEYRLTEPTAGTTSASATRVSWSERLLGPLGRPVLADPFWPFNSRGWLDAAAEGDSSALSVGSTQSVYRSVSGSAESLELSFWEVSASRRIAWIVLLTSLLLSASPHCRTRLLNPGVIFAIVAVSLAGTMLAPEFLAIPWGGLVTGISLGGLLPDRWRGLRTLPDVRRRLRPTETTRIQPTRVAMLGTALLGAMFTWSPTYAWQSDTTGQNHVGADPAGPSTEGTHFDVLVPIDGDAPTSSSPPLVAYMKQSELELLYGEDLRSPRYLLRTARYEVEEFPGPSPRITATFNVVLIDPDGSALVWVPIANAQFKDTDACRVDGHPATLLPHREGVGVVVAIPAQQSGPDSANDDRIAENHVKPRQVVVELSCQPLPASDNKQPDIHLGIPSVIDSQAVMRSGGPTPPPVEVRHLGAKTPPGADGQWRIDLGAMERLTMLYSDTDAKRESLVPREAATVVEAHPLHLQLESRLSFEMNPQRRDIAKPALVLQLPRRSIVHNVQGTELDGIQIRAGGRGPVLVHLSFLESPADVVDISLSYDIPTATTGPEMSVSIPALPFLPRTAASQFASHLVGVAAAPGFRLAASDPEGMMPGTTGIDESRLPEYRGIRRIRRAEATYRLATPRRIDLPLAVTEPRVTTVTQQTVTIGERTLDWSAQVTATVLDAATAIHRLQVDSRLEIHSVRVTQDDVRRLASWNRVSPGELTVVLTENLGGEQTIELSGALNVENSEEFAAPVVSMADAEPTSPDEIRILHDADRRIDVAGSDGGVLSAVPVAAGSADSAHLWETRIPIDDPSSPPHIHVVRTAAPLQVAQATMVTRDQSGTDRWVTTLRISVGERAAPVLDVSLSASDSDVEVAASTPVGEERTDPDGSRHIRLVDIPNSTGPIEITASGEIHHVGATLPRITVNGRPATQHFVVLSESSIFNVENPSAIPIPVRDVPDWVPPLPSTSAGEIHAWTIDEPTLKLSVPVADQTEIFLRRLDIGLWHELDGSWTGLTDADLIARHDGVVEIPVPDAIHVAEIRLNGRTVTSQGRSLVTVRLPASETAHRLTIYWSGHAKCLAGGTLPMVGPRGLSCLQTNVVLLGQSRYRYQSSAEMDQPGAQFRLRKPQPANSSIDQTPLEFAIRAAGFGRITGESDSAHQVGGILRVALEGAATELPLRVHDRPMLRLIWLVIFAAIGLCGLFLLGRWVQIGNVFARTQEWGPACVLILFTIIWLFGASEIGFLLLLVTVVAALRVPKRPQEPDSDDTQVRVSLA